MTTNKTFPKQEADLTVSLAGARPLSLRRTDSFSPLQREKPHTPKPEILPVSMCFGPTEAFIPSFMKWIMINNSPRVRNYSHALLLKMRLHPKPMTKHFINWKRASAPEFLSLVLEKGWDRVLWQGREQAQPLSQLCPSIHPPPS